MLKQISQIYLIILHIVIVLVALDYHHLIYPIDIKMTRVGRLFNPDFIDPKSQNQRRSAPLKQDNKWPLYIHSTKSLFSSVEDIMVHENHEKFIHTHYPYLMHLYTYAKYQDELVQILYVKFYGGFYYLDLTNINMHPKIEKVKIQELDVPVIVYTIEKQITAILSRPDAVFYKYVVNLINMRMPLHKYHEKDFIIGQVMIKDALQLYEENDGKLEWVHL